MPLLSQTSQSREPQKREHCDSAWAAQWQANLWKGEIRVVASVWESVEDLPGKCGIQEEVLEKRKVRVFWAEGAGGAGSEFAEHVTCY